MEVKEKIDNRHNTARKKHTIHLLLLPYQGEKGLHLTKSLKRNLKSLLPSTVKSNIDFTGKKLSTCFQIKDQTKLNTHMISFTQQRVQKIIVQKIIWKKAGAEFPKE